MDVFGRQSKALEQGVLAKPDADMSHAYRASIFTCQVVGLEIPRYTNALGILFFKGYTPVT